MRIYVIGPSGAGKTTVARKLAKKYNTIAYELDCKESYNYHPTLFQFYDMMRITRLYFKKKKEKLERIKKFGYKVVYLNNKDLKMIKK